MTDQIKPLLDALEAGPTDGPWTVLEHSWSDTSIIAPSFDHGICCLDINHATEESQEADGALMAANAAFIAAANPATIRALLSERDSLLARLDAAEADARRLDAFARPGWELSQNSDPECMTHELWQVWRVSGGRNDREWALIGQGATPRAAIDAALTQGA